MRQFAELMPKASEEHERVAATTLPRTSSSGKKEKRKWSY
jgi:hypothetical protein